MLPDIKDKSNQLQAKKFMGTTVVGCAKKASKVFFGLVASSNHSAILFFYSERISGWQRDTLLRDPDFVQGPAARDGSHHQVDPGPPEPRRRGGRQRRELRQLTW